MSLGFDQLHQVVVDKKNENFFLQIVGKQLATARNKFCELFNIEYQRHDSKKFMQEHPSLCKLNLSGGIRLLLF